MRLRMKGGWFSGFSIKVGLGFSKIPLSPNHWTILGLITAIVAAYYLSLNSFLFAAVWMIIYAFLDIVDGSVARVRGRATSSGAYLDRIVKRYVEFVIILGLLFTTLPAFLFPAYIWIAAYLFGIMITAYSKAAAKEQLDADVKGGLLERPARFVILFIGIAAAIFSTQYLVYILALLAVLANITALQRIAKARKKT